MKHQICALSRSLSLSLSLPLLLSPSLPLSDDPGFQFPTFFGVCDFMKGSCVLSQWLTAQQGDQEGNPAAILSPMLLNHANKPLRRTAGVGALNGGRFHKVQGNLPRATITQVEAI